MCVCVYVCMCVDEGVRNDISVGLRERGSERKRKREKL